MPTVGQMLEGILTEEDLNRRAQRIISTKTCSSADLSIFAHALLKIDLPTTKAVGCLLARMEELLESDQKYRDGALSRDMGWSRKGTSRSVTDVVVAGAAHALNNNQHPAKAAEALAKMIHDRGKAEGINLGYGKTAIVAAMKKHPDVRWNAEEAVDALVRVAKDV